MRKNTLSVATLSAALMMPLLGLLSVQTVVAEDARPGPSLDPLALASVLIAHGQAHRACTLLDVVYGSAATDPRALYLMGECHLAQGETQAAVRHYELALRQQPQAVAVRAKLAGVYIRLGRPEAARALLSAARDAAPRSRSAIELADLAESPPEPGVVSVAAPRNWDAEVSLARLYDSNVNGGSIASTVDAIIGGVPLALDIASSSKAKAGWGTVLSATGSYRHPLDAHRALLLRGGVSATVYDDEGEYDRQSVEAGLGVLYRDRQLTWSILPNVRYTWQAGEPDEATAAIDGRINYKINPQLGIIGAAQIGYASVPFDHDRDSWIGLVSAGVSFALNSRVSGGVQMVARRSVGDVATLAHVDLGPEVFLSAVLTDVLTVDASYSYTHVEYDDSLAMFPQGRQDNKHSVGIALSLDLANWHEGLSAFARYNYVHTESSISLHTSDRHLVAAGLKYQF